MDIVYRPRFTRRYKKLPSSRRTAVQQAIEQLLDVMETHRVPPGGLGVKRLQGDFWEIRSDIRDRIVFLLRGASLEFLFVGNHDDIRRFLKQSF